MDDRGAHHAATAEAVEAARAVADGDESVEAVARLESALLASGHLPEGLDELLEATTLYNRYGPSPFLTHREMLRAIRESGILARTVGQQLPVLDLDAFASGVTPVLERFAQRGGIVGELTWRDREEAWPQTITTDRAAVWTPESLGFILERGVEHTAGVDLLAMVIWARGWADVRRVHEGDEDGYSCIEFSTIEEAIAVLASTTEEFMRGESGAPGLILEEGSSGCTDRLPRLRR